MILINLKEAVFYIPDKMNYIQHATATITFRAKDASVARRTYSDRSMVEIRQDDNGKYILRAMDVGNKNKVRRILKILVINYGFLGNIHFSTQKIHSV